MSTTFDTPTATIVLTDLGSTPLTEGTLSISATVNGASGTALEKGTDVCIRSGGSVVANGPLARGLSLTPSVSLARTKIQPGQSNQYEISFYAGELSPCGHVVSTDPEDASAWSTPPGGATPAHVGTGTFVTPPRLDNPAEGGTVKVTIGVTSTATVSGPVTAATTSTGSLGAPTGGTSHQGSSTLPVREAAKAASTGSLAFTGMDVGVIAGSGALLLVSGIALLTWRRRLATRR